MSDAPIEQRVAALQDALIEKGHFHADYVGEVNDWFEHEASPMSGAKVVARAWTDPAYRERLLADGTAAIAELGISGPEGAHMVVVENTPKVHNVIVCTLCSCYPWPVLGPPPNWYKDAAYRSRVVASPERCSRRWAAPSPTAWTFGSGTVPPRSATLSCPSGPRAPRT